MVGSLPWCPGRYAASLRQLSAEWFDSDDAFDGGDAILPGGYDQVGRGPPPPHPHKHNPAQLPAGLPRQPAASDSRGLRRPADH